MRACSLVGTIVLHGVAVWMVATHGNAPAPAERRPTPAVLVALDPPVPPADGPGRAPPLPPAQPKAASLPAPRIAATRPRTEANADAATAPAAQRRGPAAVGRSAERRAAAEPVPAASVDAPSRRPPAEASRPPAAATSATRVTTAEAVRPAATGIQPADPGPAGPAPSAEPAAAGQPAALSTAPAASPSAASPSPGASQALDRAPTAALRTGPRVGAGFSEEAIRKVYPRSAIRMGLEGLVVLDVQVGADGRAREVRVRRSSGYDVLDEAAALMVREASFTAATVDGAPVADWLAGLRIRFALER